MISSSNTLRDYISNQQVLKALRKGESMDLIDELGIVYGVHAQLAVVCCDIASEHDHMKDDARIASANCQQRPKTVEVSAPASSDAHVHGSCLKVELRLHERKCERGDESIEGNNAAVSSGEGVVVVVPLDSRRTFVRHVVPVAAVASCVSAERVREVGEGKDSVAAAGAASISDCVGGAWGSPEHVEIVVLTFVKGTAVAQRRAEGEEEAPAVDTAVLYRLAASCTGITPTDSKNSNATGISIASWATVLARLCVLNSGGGIAAIGVEDSGITNTSNNGDTRAIIRRKKDSGVSGEPVACERHEGMSAQCCGSADDKLTSAPLSVLPRRHTHHQHQQQRSPVVVVPPSLPLALPPHPTTSGGTTTTTSMTTTVTDPRTDQSTVSPSTSAATTSMVRQAAVRPPPLSVEGTRTSFPIEFTTPSSVLPTAAAVHDVSSSDDSVRGGGGSEGGSPPVCPQRNRSRGPDSVKKRRAMLCEDDDREDGRFKFSAARSPEGGVVQYGMSRAGKVTAPAAAVITNTRATNGSAEEVSAARKRLQRMYDGLERKLQQVVQLRQSLQEQRTGTSGETAAALDNSLSSSPSMTSSSFSLMGSIGGGRSSAGGGRGPTRFGVSSSYEDPTTLSQSSPAPAAAAAALSSRFRGGYAQRLSEEKEETSAAPQRVDDVCIENEQSDGDAVVVDRAMYNSRPPTIAHSSNARRVAGTHGKGASSQPNDMREMRVEVSRDECRAALATVAAEQSTPHDTPPQDVSPSSIPLPPVGFTDNSVRVVENEEEEEDDEFIEGRPRGARASMTGSLGNLGPQEGDSSAQRMYEEIRGRCWPSSKSASLSTATSLFD